jgi:uncharacterized RDD family membrane protein YckC
MMCAVTAEVDARTNVVVRRYVQYVLDQVVVFVLALLVLLATLGITVLLAQLGVPAGKWVLYVPFGCWIATLFGSGLYFEIWYPRQMGGVTPAMRWLGLRIVLLRGGAPSLKEYFLRWLMMVVDGLLLGLVGAVLIAVTTRHQRLGDMVAGTIVVRSPAVPSTVSSAVPSTVETEVR